MNVERHLDARQSRRMAAEDRALDRLERREREAEKLVGELIRAGATVFYINVLDRRGRPTGGTKEFADFGAAISYLLRNNYA
ncbi:hypothetical protein EVB53_094 [Rhizobium phage RHph_Y60]|nr:hypothetical protein EVB53_094 [Rhizobium phage RHph_Y60]